ncbi:hypothetical protein [Paraburkholderia strydomiana]|uniref:hypothetical protein n=1 Tax=Paraburkholderia strydomiana TaxID=1245417 RepID=UPI001BE6C354|nr:hypothetical protein [Paraburkholderia strydomiana]MBT2794761.1 hypothetical protein [Paraburkholderia strydomiana]
MRVLASGSNLRAVQAVAEQVISIGHEAAIAWPAASAIEMAAKWTPDAALVDIESSGDDAHHVCRMLRSNPVLSRCKIVALPESSTIDFVAVSLFDAILERPVDVSALVSLLGRGGADTSGE